MSKRGPRRQVVRACCVSGSAGNSATQWELKLSCGHTAFRHRQAGKQNRNWKRYPAPRFVYCKACFRCLNGA